MTTLWFLLGFICLSYSQVQVEVNVGETSCTCVPYNMCKKNSTHVTSANTAEDTKYYFEGDVDSITINITVRTKEGKCSHYLDTCCFPEDMITPTPPPVPPTSKPQENCGNRNPDGVGIRLKGDETNEAQYGEFPWMVTVLRQGSVIDNITGKSMECGGSIIHPQVVLTAARCVKGKHDLYIRAGEWDTQREEMVPTQDRNVKEVIIHEGYYAGGFHNDIALLVLDRPLNMTMVVGTLCLPDQDEVMDGRNCVVSGWGKDAYGKQGKYQTFMQQVDQPVVGREPCEEALRKTDLGPNYSLHESLFCAGGVIGQGACQGDLGSPLACPRKTDNLVYVQAGVVAYVLDCGTETPTAYTNVAHFRNWIDDKIASLNVA